MFQGAVQVVCLVFPTKGTKRTKFHRNTRYLLCVLCDLCGLRKTLYTGTNQLLRLMWDELALFIHPLFQFLAHFKIGEPFAVHTYEFAGLRIPSRIG
jgi:hypothetical protein